MARSVILRPLTPSRYAILFKITSDLHFVSQTEFLKVKNDHRSKFPNLRNCKEETWKKSGLQLDSNPGFGIRRDALPTELVEHRTGIAVVTVSNPFEALIFFRLLLSSCLNWKLDCEPFFTLIYNRSTNMNYFIYTSHHATPYGRYELNKLTSLPTCGFIAQLVEHTVFNIQYL